VCSYIDGVLKNAWAPLGDVSVCGTWVCGMLMRAFCSIATEVFGYAAICGTGLQRLSRAISEAISEAEARPASLPVSYAQGLNLRDNVGSSRLCMTIGR
jgi:hypothetical protein